MTREQALVLLSYHSARNLDCKNPKWENGFVASLRKFNGSVIEKDFIEVMECLRVLAKEFESEKIDRNLMADIYEILYSTTSWLGEGGLLSDINSEMKKKLECWMKIYSYAVALLLDYTKPDCYEKAFDEYNDYLKGISNYE